jgi:hypothetical protein
MQKLIWKHYRIGHIAFVVIHAIAIVIILQMDSLSTSNRWQITRQAAVRRQHV